MVVEQNRDVVKLDSYTLFVIFKWVYLIRALCTDFNGLGRERGSIFFFVTSLRLC